MGCNCRPSKVVATGQHTGWATDLDTRSRRVSLSSAMPNPPRLLTPNGITKPLNEWANEAGIPPGTLRARLDQFGWTVAEALAAPVDRRFSHADSGKPNANTPRPVPKLKRQKDGSAVVRWSSKGKRHWRDFGRYGSPEANEAYQRFALEWVEGMVSAREMGAEVTVYELAELYLDHADEYYRKNSERTSEYHAISGAMGVFCDVVGAKIVGELIPDDLRLVVREAVDRGLSLRCATSSFIISALAWA